MKKIAFILSALLISGFAVFAQSPEDENVNAAEISFDKLVHDYGKIYHNGDGNCEFKFTNIGKEPLVLTNVRSSCGCTVPKWPRKPILPGKSDVIKVKYNTSRLGKINKTITVQSNGKTSHITLRIAGQVVLPPKEVVPEKKVEEGASPVAK